VEHESDEENLKTGGAGAAGYAPLFSGKLSQFCDSLNLPCILPLVSKNFGSFLSESATIDSPWDPQQMFYKTRCEMTNIHIWTPE
jgi:hypothetical protein